MKRNLLLIAVLILAGFNAFSQEPVILNVVYEFKYVRDLSQKNNPLTTNMVLSLGKETSRFCSEQLYNERIDPLQKKENQSQSQPKNSIVVTGGPMLTVGKGGVIINEEIVKNRANATIETAGHIAFKTYYVPENLPKINWSLQSEKKIIGKYNCQKATGKYAGRTYEVWFTSELPFSDGPYKLNGLPGLILEGQDATGEVVFTFKDISQSPKENEVVSSFVKDQSSIKATPKDYNRSLEAFITDPESATLALFPDARIYVRNVDDANDHVANKVKKYNPIELK
jgi:GLPGLI family protein